MPTKRRPLSRVARRGLTKAQCMELDIDQAGGRPGGFATDAKARAAWVAHREEQMRGHRPGFRPAAWWRFESPVPKPQYYSGRALLHDRGLLDAEERAALEALWEVAGVTAADLRNELLDLDPLRWFR